MNAQGAAVRLGMACDCIEQLNQLLAPRNLEIRMTVLFGGGPTAPQIFSVPTLPLDIIERKARQKGGAETITPKFCPFCGKSINLPKDREATR